MWRRNFAMPISFRSGFDAPMLSACAKKSKAIPQARRFRASAAIYDRLTHSEAAKIADVTLQTVGLGRVAEDPQKSCLISIEFAAVARAAAVWLNAQFRTSYLALALDASRSAKTGSIRSAAALLDAQSVSSICVVAFPSRRSFHRSRRVRHQGKGCSRASVYRDGRRCCWGRRVRCSDQSRT